MESRVEILPLPRSLIPLLGYRYYPVIQHHRQIPLRSPVKRPLPQAAEYYLDQGFVLHLPFDSLTGYSKIQLTAKIKT